MRFGIKAENLRVSNHSGSFLPIEQLRKFPPVIKLQIVISEKGERISRQNGELASISAAVQFN